VGISLTYPIGEEGDILLVQMITTCRRGAWGVGWVGSALWNRCHMATGSGAAFLIILNFIITILNFL